MVAAIKQWLFGNPDSHGRLAMSIRGVTGQTYIARGLKGKLRNTEIII
jgi:hypothetical protein